MAAHTSGHVVVIGIGDVDRRDDGVGPAVVTRLAERAAVRPVVRGMVLVCCKADPGALVHAFDGADLAVAVSAALPGGPVPGRVSRLELASSDLSWSKAEIPHGPGIGAALELAHALGRMPQPGGGRGDLGPWFGQRLIPTPQGPQEQKH
jgi:hydrogenase maturation protease